MCWNIFPPSHKTYRSSPNPKSHKTCRSGLGPPHTDVLIPLSSLSPCTRFLLLISNRKHNAYIKYPNPWLATEMSGRAAVGLLPTLILSIRTPFTSKTNFSSTPDVPAQDTFLLLVMACCVARSGAVAPSNDAGDPKLADERRTSTSLDFSIPCIQ